MNCKRCGTKIPQERLEVIPETRLCVKCSEEVGGDFDVRIVEENFGDSIISSPIIEKRLKEIEPL